MRIHPAHIRPGIRCCANILLSAAGKSATTGTQHRISTCTELKTRQQRNVRISTYPGSTCWRTLPLSCAPGSHSCGTAGWQPAVQTHTSSTPHGSQVCMHSLCLEGQSVPCTIRPHNLGRYIQVTQAVTHAMSTLNCPRACLLFTTRSPHCLPQHVCTGVQRPSA